MGLFLFGNIQLLRKPFSNSKLHTMHTPYLRDTFFLLKLIDFNHVDIRACIVKRFFASTLITSLESS